MNRNKFCRRISAVLAFSTFLSAEEFVPLAERDVITDPNAPPLHLELGEEKHPSLYDAWLRFFRANYQPWLDEGDTSADDLASLDGALTGLARHYADHPFKPHPGQWADSFSKLESSDLVDHGLLGLQMAKLECGWLQRWVDAGFYRDAVRDEAHPFILFMLSCERLYDHRRYQNDEKQAQVLQQIEEHLAALPTASHSEQVFPLLCT